MADGRVIIDTALNNKGFVRGVGSLRGELGGLTSVVKKLGAVIGVAFGVKALYDFGKASIELGSNVAEVQNVVDVAFGDMAYKIEDFAKTSIQSFGMSRLAAKKTASTYMAMAKGMGMAEGTASDMAIALTGLSGDVASFFNISQELADVKLKSVFTGETETLKDLGVVMTQTNLKAYAMSKGIGKSLETMTKAELVALRYEFVMDQLSLAHGDFARTADSWANQTRILSMQWQEFMSIMGQMLITVLKPLVVTLNSIVAAMIDTANTVNSVMTALFGGTSAQMQQTQQDASGVGDAIEGSVEDQNGLTEAVEDTNKEAKKSLAAFDEIHKLTEDTQSNAGGADEPSAPSTGGITSVGGEEVEGFSKKMTALIESLRAGFQELKGWVTDFFKPFQDSWAAHGQAVIQAAKGALSSVIDLLRSVGTAFMDAWSDGTGVAVLSNIHGIVAGILNLARTLADRFREAWAANDNGKEILNLILGNFNIILGTIRKIIDATVEWARGLDLEPLLSAIKEYLKAYQPVFQIICDTLVEIWKDIVLPFFGWLLETAFPKILEGLTQLYQYLSEHPELVKTLTKLVVAFIAAWKFVEIISAIGHIVSALNPLVIALSAIAGLALLVAMNFDKMNTVERFQAVFGAIAAAAGILAVALFAVTGGVAGIVAGVAAIVVGVGGVLGAINSANSRARGGGFGGNRSGGGFSSAYSLSAANIPRLATGAVIPANREFLAVLGDQKSGTNVEAPLSTIEQAVENAMNRRGGGSGEMTLVLDGDLAALARVFRPYLLKEGRRVGVKLTGG